MARARVLNPSNRARSAARKAANDAVQCDTRLFLSPPRKVVGHYLCQWAAVSLSPGSRIPLRRLQGRLVQGRVFQPAYPRAFLFREVGEPIVIFRTKKAPVPARFRETIFQRGRCEPENPAGA